jgi:hypothetical protein
MSKTANISPELNIKAPAGHPVMAENQAAIRERVEQYVADLRTGLGIAEKMKVRWEKQSPGHDTVEASVNGLPARLRYTTSTNLGLSPALFALAFCEDVLRNRALFITPEIMRNAASTAHSSFQKLEEKQQLRVAQILFAQGFGLQRLADYKPPANDEDKTPEVWAETCIGELEATSLTVIAHPSQIDPDENPLDFNRLIEGVDYFLDAGFKIKGVPFPKSRGEKRSDFAPDDLAFRINDLLFPIRKIEDVLTENQKFVSFLAANGAFFLNRGAVNFLLESLESANPNLLVLLRSRFDTDRITAILRNLAAEGISVRPLVRIFEIFISGGEDFFQQEPDKLVAPPLSETVHLTADEVAIKNGKLALSDADWSELVRINLKNATINRALPYFDEPFVLSSIVFEPPVLRKIARLESLPKGEQAELLWRIHRQIGENYLSPVGKIRAVVTSAAFRKKVSELIAFEFPEIPVFSFQECLPRIISRPDVAISLEE